MPVDDKGRVYELVDEGLPPTVAVGTTATEVFPHNPNRERWHLANNTAAPGTVDLTKQVSATQGAPLQPNGGVVAQSYERHGRDVHREVFARLDVAGTLYRRGWVRLYSGEVR